MLKGALAAAVTPLRNEKRLSTRTCSPRTSSTWRAGLEGILGARHEGEASCSRRTSGSGPRRCSSLRPGTGSTSLSTAVQTTAGRSAGSARGRDRRGRGRRDRAAVLCARRGGARSAFRRGRGPALRCRSTSTSFARGPGTRFRLRRSSASASWRRTSRSEGLEPAVQDVEPYLIEGLDVSVGPESLVVRGSSVGCGRGLGLAAVPEPWLGSSGSARATW